MKTHVPKPPAFAAPPPGVIEHRSSSPQGVPCNLYGNIVGLSDGSLMLAYPEHGGLKTGDPVSSACRISSDGGKTWGPPRPLKSPIGIHGIVRTKSGKLAAHGDRKFGDRSVYFSSSADDGRTWSPPLDIGTYPDFYPYLHSLTELSCGRLLLAGYWEGLNASFVDLDGEPGAPDTYPSSQFGWGLWRGRTLFCEGHRGPELGINLVYYSDDEGATWVKNTGGIFGWFDDRGIPNGERGVIDVNEPNVAETNDGRLLMIMRSKTGRLLQCYSLDRGRTWLSVLPTELAASQTTPMLIRIPRSGDLLCVWNQVSGEEIRRGFQRGRLSAALSRDNGLTWGNFRTLELQEGMEDTARVTPEFPLVVRIVARIAMGVLPDGFMMFSQPNIDIVGDQVFLRYSRIWPQETDNPDRAPVRWPQFWPIRENPATETGAAMTGWENVLRIYPLEWFYESDDNR